jgi:hypothetical protein
MVVSTPAPAKGMDADAGGWIVRKESAGGCFNVVSESESESSFCADASAESIPDLRPNDLPPRPGVASEGALRNGGRNGGIAEVSAVDGQ